jgi:hypothetical protein
MVLWDIQLYRKNQKIKGRTQGKIKIESEARKMIK